MKLATPLNANIIQGAGLTATIASLYQPTHSPLEDLLSSLGLALVWGGLAVHAYVWGVRQGRREALRVEINRVWSESLPFNFTEGK